MVNFIDLIFVFIICFIVSFLFRKIKELKTDIVSLTTKIDNILKSNVKNESIIKGHEEILLTTLKTVSNMNTVISTIVNKLETTGELDKIFALIDENNKVISNIIKDE